MVQKDMNKYMRAIGFQKYSIKDFERMLLELGKHREYYRMGSNWQNERMFEICQPVDGNRENADMAGILWSGFEFQDELVCERCTPVAYSTYFTPRNLSVEEKISGHEYTGAFEETQTGVFIIFYLANAVEYLNHCKDGKAQNESVFVALAGLSLNGTILFPVAKSRDGIERKQKEQRYRIKLMAEAKKGNEKAMEQLAFQDMNIYTKVSRRIQTEDVFTIVESSFMPYGTECELYSIVADIVETQKIKNIYTKELIWKLLLNYNGILLPVYINEQDLLGEPQAGRRFKGSFWLQGVVKFN